MYKGFVLLRTDNKEISDFFEDIFKGIPILIKINKNVNVKELLESSIKAVLLDKNCTDYYELFYEFNKKDIGVISVGKDGDIKWPFNKEEVISKINEKDLYIPEIKRFDLHKKLPGFISPLVEKIFKSDKSNKEIYEEFLKESKKKRKNQSNKWLIKKFKLSKNKIKLNKKLTGISSFFKKKIVEKEEKGERKKPEETLVKEFLNENKKDSKVLEKNEKVREVLEERKKDEKIIKDLNKLSNKEKDVEKVTVNPEKINSEPEKIDSESKNMSVLVLEIKDEEEFNY